MLLLQLACASRPVDLAGPRDSASSPDANVLGVEAETFDRLLAMGPRGPIPTDPTNDVADLPEAAHLGRWLFFDKRLSGDGTIACASCHDPEEGLADGAVLGEGMAPLGRHTPSLWDTAYNRWYFWDGRADSHWAQAAGPAEADSEQGGSRLAFAHLVQDDADLNAAYSAVFGPVPDVSDEGRFPSTGNPGLPGDLDTLRWESMAAADQAMVTQVFVNLCKAIAAYERLLITPDTRIDAFVAGLERGEVTGVLTAEEVRGAVLFAGRANCHFCHAGALFTNREFHNIGLESMELDYGRFQGITSLLGDEFNAASVWSDAPEKGDHLRLLAQTPEQLGQFKVPSLRGILQTAPYMHDGSLATLSDVIAHYDEADGLPPVGHLEELVVPLELTDDEKADLEAFLRALEPVGTFEPDLLTQPTTPVYP